VAGNFLGFLIGTFMVLFTASCQAAPTKQVGGGFLVPYTKIRSMELLFLSDLPTHIFFEPSDGHKLCRNSDFLKQRRARLTDHVLRSNVMKIGSEDSCKITVLKKPPPFFKYNKKIANNKCKYYLNIKGNNLHHLYFIRDHSNIDLYDKCFFRMGLFMMGMNGALEIEDARLFVPRKKSPWAALPAGESSVPLVQYFMDLCTFEMKRFESREEADLASENVMCGTIAN
jgi:hypothetical protein